MRTDCKLLDFTRYVIGYKNRLLASGNYRLFKRRWLTSALHQVVDVWMYVWFYICMVLCLYVLMYVCMYVWLYMDGCMYVCMVVVVVLTQDDAHVVIVLRYIGQSACVCGSCSGSTPMRPHNETAVRC